MNHLQHRGLVAAEIVYERLSPVGILGIVLIVLALFQVVAIDLPAWHHERALKSQLALLRHQLGQLSDIPPAIVVATPSDSPLPAETDLPGVLADVSRIAQDNHLAFPAAEYTWTAPTSSSFGQYELQFEIKGGYLPIRHFIEDVENAEPAIAFRELSFTRDNATQNDLRSKIRLVIFTKKSAV